MAGTPGSGSAGKCTDLLDQPGNYLLDQQIRKLEETFVEEGGYSEQLAAARMAERSRQNNSADAKSAAIPMCPLCGKVMVLRTVKNGPHAGSRFWGCSAYPLCKGLVEL